MFAAPRVIESRVFARIPDARLLEGPSFDRAGNLYVVDIPSGRMFRISSSGKSETSPNTMASPMASGSTRTAAFSSPTTSWACSGSIRRRKPVSVALDRPYAEHFKGVNDLSSPGTATSISPTRERATFGTLRAASTACAPTGGSTASSTMHRARTASCSRRTRASSIWR